MVTYAYLHASSNADGLVAQVPIRPASPDHCRHAYAVHKATNDSALMLYGDTTRSAALRHEVPLTIVDPLLFIEVEGRRVVVIGELDVPRVEKLDGLEVLSAESLGFRELVGAMPAQEAALEVARRACAELGVAQAVVPGDFPLVLARALETAGVGIEPMDEVFTERRRSKSEAELGGIRAAQRSADAAIARVRGILEAVDSTDGGMTYNGLPLTSEYLRAEILDVIRAEDADLDELIVSHGPQTAIGHEPGHGQLLPGEPIIVDIWPRDRASACYTDMTRTFVCGEPPEQLVSLHELCAEAMTIALQTIKPGAPTLATYKAVCEFFERNGHWTPLAEGIERPDALSGFPYALGHGVGLELHEQPVLSRGNESTFVSGDVVAIEPALYIGGFGGCRLEDTVVVTEHGCRRVTEATYEMRC
jgi:Xaa-Pro aminopeptidase